MPSEPIKQVFSLRQSPGRRWLTLLGCSLVVLTISCSRQADVQSPLAPPATVQEAAKVLDLARFPTTPGLDYFSQRSLARLSYRTSESVQQSFDFQKDQLASRGWTQLPDGDRWSGAAGGVFTREGYCLSVSVSGGRDSNVLLVHHGNVPLDRLPVPRSARPWLANSTRAYFITETPAADTAEACRNLLLADGWQPYGQAENYWYFKQNAVQLMVGIDSQGPRGQTIIFYATQLMSADLPAPAETVELHYNDQNTTLWFDTLQTPTEIVAFYRNTLSRAGWQATTDNASQVDHKSVLSFRNSRNDLLTLEMFEAEQRERVVLKFETAAQVAENTK